MKRMDLYEIKRGDNLASARYWNGRLEDIDIRLSSAEVMSDQINTATDEMISEGLRRIDDTLEPMIADAEHRLETVGLYLSTSSTTSLTVGTGEKTLVIAEADREGYAPTAYVLLRDQDDHANTMLGELESFERETGTLVIDVTSIGGSGTHAAWDVLIGVPTDITHAGRTDNPHQTTAVQVGAPTTAQFDVLAGTVSSQQAQLATLQQLANTVAGQLATLTDLSARITVLEDHAIFDESKA